MYSPAVLLPAAELRFPDGGGSARSEQSRDDMPELRTCLLREVQRGMARGNDMRGLQARNGPQRRGKERREAVYRLGSEGGEINSDKCGLDTPPC